VKTVPDYHSFKDLFIKRLRWLTVMRHMRPWGHIGLAFTQGLPWSLAALLVHPFDGIGAAYFGAYLLFRIAITGLVGAWGMQQHGLWKKMPLFLVWDATAFVIWLLTLGRRNIRWRNVDYRIRDGRLVPVAPNPVQNSAR
jgi:ceramide glucosyltransferase